MKPACAQSTDAYANPGEQLPLPVTVAEIGKIHFEGNIIPHRWYQRILLDSGKPNLPAITILAEIIYWYRPYQILDKKGQPLLRKHFDGDMFQCSAAYFQAKFGLTKDQTRKALKRLEDGGYIRREYRDIVQQGILRNNIMFIEPLPLAIIAITHPAAPPKTPPPGPGTLSPVGDTLSPVGDTLSPVGDTLSPVGDFFKGIKITTETTTEITTETTTTTPNPSSSTERAAVPEPMRSGSGDQDEQPQDQDGNPEAAAQEPTDEQPVNQEEMQAAPALEDHNDTPPETPKTVSQEEGQTAPTTEDSSDTPTKTPKTVASEEGVNPPQPEHSAEVMNPPQLECNAEGVNTPQPELNVEVTNPPPPELTDPTAAPAATLAEVAYPDAQNTAQKGLKGVIQGEPHSSLLQPLRSRQRPYRPI